MSVYRYYLPGVKAKDVTDDTLATMGLSERLRDCSIKRHNGNRIVVTDFNANGPDGKSGALVTPQPADRKGVPSLKPENIEAHKSQHDADYWIVWDKMCPPTPEGLQRWETVRGVVCELGDGRLWECPTISSFGRYPRVPQCYSRSNGKVLSRVMPEYAVAWDLSGLWSLRLLEENRDVPVCELFGTEVAFDSCLKFLGLNYRISDEEAYLIGGLLNDASMATIIDAAVDMAFILSAPDDQKKSAAWQEVSDGLRSFLRGLEASTPDTRQPAPTSS